MHFARKGLITEEMAFVAQREKISAELIRSEVAVGRMIIPANINHVELEADGDRRPNRSARSTPTSATPPSPQTWTKNCASYTPPSTTEPIP